MAFNRNQWMGTIVVEPFQIDSFQFWFAQSVHVERYESWEHYRRIWNRHGNQKAVDAVAIEDPAIVWLIEAKDFRVITKPPRPAQVRDLPATIHQKMRDTLAGLTDAAYHATAENERFFAKNALAQPRRRVVVHLEPHPVDGKHVSLFPHNFRANVTYQLRRLLKDIDSDPLVLSIATTRLAQVPWTVE